MAAATGCDVILPAANPSYELWETMVPALTNALVKAAVSVGASIVLPGNVYAYGDTMPATISPNTPHQPNCVQGSMRSELENTLKAAAHAHGVQTLIVRAGGYLEGKDTGNWFESYMCKDLSKNRFMYPGAMDTVCTWAYLPDVAELMVRVAELRARLTTFDDIGFPGYAITGAQLHQRVESATGRTLTLTHLPWWVIRVMSWFKPMMRGVYNMRYLFHVPHSIDGARLNEILPDWHSTPIDRAMPSMLAELEDRALDMSVQSAEC